MDEKILVTRSSMPDFDEYVEMIKPLWESHWLTNMGKYHVELEQRLKEYLEVENVSLFTNGHMALELLLQSLNLKGEVITTPFTFASTTHAIVRNGLQPVFADINKDDFTIDASKIENLITENTVAILPVHVYGNVCNVKEIQRIAEKYNLKVIYDAAHAFGERYEGHGIGEFGDASMFSFHATKVFNTIEGGAVVYKDKNVGKELYKLKNFGIASEEVVNGIGANAKMNEFQAAMGICNLRHLEHEIQKRKKVVEKYRKCLEGVKGLKLNPVQENLESNYAYFPVVFEEDFGKSRDEIYDILKENNIFARKYFYPLTNSFECFEGKYDTGDTPVALEISKRILTLPLYADLQEEQVERICSIILQ